MKPFSDVFESPESESEVTLVQKKSSQALENMRALVVHNCTPIFISTVPLSSTILYTVSFHIKKRSRYNATDLITICLLQVPSPSMTMHLNTLSSRGALNKVACQPHLERVNIVWVGGKFRLKEQIGSGSFGLYFPLILTAVCSTEGAASKFPFWGTFL